jgi:hypothetical protein
MINSYQFEDFELLSLVPHIMPFHLNTTFYSSHLKKNAEKKKNSVSNFFPSVYPPGINDGVLENPNRS